MKGKGKLSSDDSIRGSKQDLNIFSPSNGVSSRANDQSTDENLKPDESRVFICKDQGLDADASGHFPCHPYSSLATRPYYGSFNRSLGGEDGFLDSQAIILSIVLALVGGR
ncbi:hypothetical protein Peur_004101 [Populus x canadensis]